MRVVLSIMFLSLVTDWAAFTQALNCDMAQYKEITGLTAAVETIDESRSALGRQGSDDASPHRGAGPERLVRQPACA